MAVVIETTLGDITVDLYLKQRPVTCLNFLKLCKMKYYNFNLFHTIRSGFIAQTGDPTGEGSGGESIWGLLEGPEKRFFSGEKMPKIRHTDAGLLAMVCTGDMMVGSQFYFTLASDLDSLDGVHCIIGEVTEGREILSKLNEVICDETHRPYQDVRITHTVVLEDPFNDPPSLMAPSRSPSPSAERLKGGRIAPDEEIDETQGKTAEEIQEMVEEKEAKARATILEIVGDLPDADIAPPENVLFVCKLNPVTTDEDLEIIFSRFGKIVSCEVIRDKKTGDSLQYAFIEFADKQSCEDAYFKMDNVLIDDRRIHVDFSQSVSKMKWLGKGRGVKYLNENESKTTYTGHDKSKRSRSRERNKNSSYDKEREEKFRHSSKHDKMTNNNDRSKRHSGEKQTHNHKSHERSRSRSRIYDHKNATSKRERSHGDERREGKQTLERSSKHFRNNKHDDKHRESTNNHDYSTKKERVTSHSKNHKRYTSRSPNRKEEDSNRKTKHNSKSENNESKLSHIDNPESTSKYNKLKRKHSNNETKHNIKDSKKTRYDEYARSRTPSPVAKKKNEKHQKGSKEKNCNKKNNKKNKNLKKKRKQSTSSSESDSSDSSSSSSSSSSSTSSSSDSDRKKKKLRRKKRKDSTTSSSSSDSSDSSSSSSSSDSSSDSSSSSSDSDPKRRKKQKKGKKVDSKTKHKL
ncbi:unnamed protein product [Parnassius mnemosyne]|uniref:Peptidyl-prolyl cis-trans isomerase n=1 Tax=Parnassius mnemosyne TaxID=213953 RepID=A0AAV1KVK2_9NEOP